MNICTLTEAAKQQIDLLCEENSKFGVSLNIKGGGCAGFEYEWGLLSVEEVEDESEVLNAGTGKLVIAPHSLMFLVGTVIDYKKDIMGSMFNIQNPNAQSSCGCGISVNFDMDSIPQIIG
jgi:iron-sulfur cluster assembly accessory protein|tara:strand:- start:226 stop:585 length:360 start_codon:yes stop_codon:yes gene_type:complete